MAQLSGIFVKLIDNQGAVEHQLHQMFLLWLWSLNSSRSPTPCPYILEIFPGSISTRRCIGAIVRLRRG